jgi:TolB-like protein/tetratricopeptide (TPR) repeat protein
MRLIDELKRRNVFRVGAAYFLLGWVVIQVTDTVSPALNLPPWTLSLVTWLGIIGFPFALFFAWAFELTPDGIRREIDAADSVSSRASGQKLDVALVVLLTITIGLIAWGSISDEADITPLSNDRPAETNGSATATTEASSIAVLPLINMSADADNAYFAGGVHEEILTNLSRIDDLRVISRTTALRYLDSDLSLKNIGRDLGVRFIVEGSVRRVNNHVRVTVQLIDAASDTHLWASNYDRELVDVFAVQSEIAAAITNSLHLEIQPDTIGTLDDMPTQSVKAYDLYMKAMSIGRSEPESESALLRQRELLESAVSTDPKFVEAWAQLNEILDHSSRNIIQQKWFGETQSERNASFEEIQRAAQRALEKAISLDPENVMTLLAQASNFVLEQESPKYQIERKIFIDRALEIEPDNAIAWLVLGWWHRLIEEYDAATPAFERALELDPLHARIVDSALSHFRLIGDQEMTTLLFDRLTQLAPEKAEIEGLSEVHPLATLENTFTLFLQTADESVIDDYKENLASLRQRSKDTVEVDPKFIQLRLRLFEFRLMQMRGDPISAFKHAPVTLPDDASDQVLFWYLWSEASSIAIAKLAEDQGEIEAAAHRMLNARTRLDDSNGGFGTIAEFPMSIAHVELGNADDVSRLRLLLGDDDDDGLFSHMSGGPFYAYSVVDTDAAVRRALQRKREHPSWYGTDSIAAQYVMNRHLVVHPEMQAFYLEEGKWIDYLAARVPEYARFSQ